MFDTAINTYKTHRKIVIVILLTLVAVASISFIFSKPKAVNVLLCGDVCTGKETGNIYEGVSDPAECKKIGGVSYSYIGHGEITVCLTDESQRPPKRS